MKEHGFVQDERDPCLFANTELDICIGVHVDDMLAVGPSELTKNLFQELAKDKAMRWSMVTDKPQEFLGRSLCRTPQGYTFVVSCDYVTKLCKTFVLANSRGPTHSVSRDLMPMTLSWTNLDNAVTDSCLVSYSGWIVLTSRTQFANCPLTSAQLPLRDEINIKRLLRYLIGNPACNMTVRCNLDVPGIAGTPRGSVVVMTDAEWAGDVKDSRNYSGIAVWVTDSVDNTWYPVHVSSKKQNMVCLSSGESALMALVGGACEGIATRDQWSKMCKCSPGTIVLCTDSAAALGFVKRKGASRRARHVDTKVYFVQAWAMEAGQRILKVHGDSQQVADCLTKIMTPQAARRRALVLCILLNIDERVRKISAHQITASD